VVAPVTHLSGCFIYQRERRGEERRGGERRGEEGRGEEGRGGERRGEGGGKKGGGIKILTWPREIALHPLLSAFFCDRRVIRERRQ
jgi:hypothetical protein